MDFILDFFIAFLLVLPEDYADQEMREAILKVYVIHLVLCIGVEVYKKVVSLIEPKPQTTDVFRGNLEQSHPEIEEDFVPSFFDVIYDYEPFSYFYSFSFLYITLVLIALEYEEIGK